MNIYTVDSADISLVAATAKTAVQIITPATLRAKIMELTVSFSSVTATDPPVLVEMIEQSTAGTSSATTPEPQDPADPATLLTALRAFTAEPTFVKLLQLPWRVSPVGGLFVYQWPEDEEMTMPISKRYALRLTSPNALSNVRAGLKYQD